MLYGIRAGLIHEQRGSRILRSWTSVLRSSEKFGRGTTNYHELHTFHRCNEGLHDMATYAYAILTGLGQSFEGVYVLDDDASVLELDRPALLELAKGPGYRHPLAADHGAQLLVGVVGGDAVALAAYHTF
jgi:hypothetical protein